MGAQTFLEKATGKNAREAFSAACEQARYEYGHRGYTGSLAEKHEFTVIKMPMQPAPDADEKDVYKEAVRYAENLINEGDERIDDKWGPAGCIEYLPGKFLFFGWASS
jgi:hypothetical protein